MKFVRLYTDGTGATHFEEIPVTDLPARRYGAPDHGIVFRERPGGTVSDYHNAPLRQYIFFLTCGAEIGVKTGSVVMEPGDVLLVEDTSGDGHTTRILNTGICAYVPIGADRAGG